MRRAGHLARMGKRIDVYQYLVGKLEGKGPLWRPRRKLEDNITMDFQEVECGSLVSSSWLRLRTVVGHLCML